MKKIFFYIAFLSFCCMQLNAQEEFVSPQAKLISKFSFIQLTGGIIILTATIDEQKDSLHFILDTGSSGISLDSSTVNYYDFKFSETDRLIRGIAGVKKVKFTYGHYLKFPNFKTDTFSFHIVDYDLLSSVYGMKIDGIIGFSFLRKYIVKIDYNKNILEVYTPGSIKYPRNGYLLKPNFSALPLPGVSVQDATVVNTKFIFDTGAGLCFLLSKEFTEDSLLLKKKKKKYTTQTEGLGGKKLMELTSIKKVTIGPYKFRNVPVYIFDDEYNVCNYPQMGGVIGNDILRRFNVILNYPEQSIHLKPNDRFSESFDYSYTGLSIYMIEHEITITDIVQDSPGDKAGFKPGDIILAVDNVFTKNIQTIKTALQQAGTDVKLLILRDEKPLVLTIKVKNILN